VPDALGEAQGSGELGQTQGECGLEHDSISLFAAMQYNVFRMDRQCVKGGIAAYVRRVDAMGLDLNCS